MRSPVCFQINLAPGDVRYVVHTLPHQMRVFADHVDEIQFTLDTRHLRTSKYRASNFEESLAALRSQLLALCKSYSHAYIAEIDFSESAVKELSRALPIAGDVPISAYNGSPFYGYLFGVYHAKSPYIFHIDADMLFGGHSTTWLPEAISYLENDDRFLVVNPLGGPPKLGIDLERPNGERLNTPYPAFAYKIVSSRIYFADRKRLLETPLPILKARGKRGLQAFLNNAPRVLPYEDCLTEALTQRGLLRLDFLGDAPGLWALHASYRSERFYNELPSLVTRIEAGDVPDAQRGDYNVNDSMIDWSDVRKSNTTLSKIWRYLGYARHGVAELITGR